MTSRSRLAGFSSLGRLSTFQAGHLRRGLAPRRSFLSRAGLTSPASRRATTRGAAISSRPARALLSPCARVTHSLPVSPRWSQSTTGGATWASTISGQIIHRRTA